MPTYDYKCSVCGHAFEQFQSMKDKVLRTCPNCGKKALERLIGTGAAIVFKGSGFYQTDYRSENYKKAKEAEGKSPGSDAKPADASPSTAKSCDNDAKVVAAKPADAPTKPAEKSGKSKNTKAK